MKKIALVGAGRVGEAAAQILAKEELARDLVLIGVREGVSEGTALDLEECGTLFGFDTRVHGGTSLDLMADADLLIISAGVARKPGMSRSDVFAANLPVIDAIAERAQLVAPHAMALVVTNPVDVFTYRFWQKTGWDRARVFGLSGVLDGARMAEFIALETGLSVRDIHALVIGGHGDSMVPLPRFSAICGIPLEFFLPQPTIERITERARGGGAEILALKKNSSAYDAPGAAIAMMVDAVVHDRHRILACVCPLDGEYGERGLAMGVPVVLGAQGIERVLELPLSLDEGALLARSADAIRDDLKKLDDL